MHVSLSRSRSLLIFLYLSLNAQLSLTLCMSLYLSTLTLLIFLYGLSPSVDLSLPLYLPAIPAVFMLFLVLNRLVHPLIHALALLFLSHCLPLSISTLSPPFPQLLTLSLSLLTYYLSVHPYLSA